MIQRSPLLVLALTLAACSQEAEPASAAPVPPPVETPLASVTEDDVTFAYHGERPAEWRIGEMDLRFELRNDRMLPLRYVRSDESGDGPLYMVEIREGDTTREESPWWCGQGLEIVELAPGEAVEVLVPAYLMEGDGLRALVDLFGPADDQKPLLIARSPEVAARQ